MSRVLAYGVLALVLAGTAGAAGSLVTSAQIKDHTIQVSDIAPSTLAYLRSRVGPRGFPGARGPSGTIGPAGGFDPKKVSQVAGHGDVKVGQGVLMSDVAFCPAGTVLIGGGGLVSGAVMQTSAPVADHWTAAATVTGGVGVGSVQAVAICAAQ